jgi:chromosome segregation ATPase
VKNFLYNIFALAVLGGFIFYFQDPISTAWEQNRNHYFPCTAPIAYSIGTFDTEFNISKEEFKEILQKAEKIWETPSGKDLFKYEDDGSLKVNLIYDNRQEATKKLQKIDAVLDNNEASYKALKSKYDAAQATFKVTKAQYEQRVAVFETRKSAYEKDVSYWNAHGGATQKEYARLSQERTYLTEEADQINKKQDVVNAQVIELNALAEELNALARTLHIDVNKYNEISKENGEEFNEGIYHTGPEGQKIDIYQFESKDKLIRVLTHELGHALGLDHVENPEAIMYRLNSGDRLELTVDDMAALQAKCDATLF